MSEPLTDGERLFFIIRLSALMDIGIDRIDAIQQATCDLDSMRALDDDDSMGAQPLAMLRDMLGVGKADVKRDCSTCVYGDRYAVLRLVWSGLDDALKISPRRWKDWSPVPGAESRWTALRRIVRTWERLQRARADAGDQNAAAAAAAYRCVLDLVEEGLDAPRESVQAGGAGHDDDADKNQ